MLNKGLSQTASLWGPIQTAYRWLHALTHRLDNAAGLTGAQVRRQVAGVLGAMKRWLPHSGPLSEAIHRFLKVTRSYWPGLFHCYDLPGLPRTNNDLEQLFGRHRTLERRITGRKVASAGLVLRGQVRLVAATLTRLRPFQPDELVLRSVDSWRSLRDELDAARYKRVLQRRFRQDPDAYLAALEAELDQLTLPP
jgi:hypothetical protein